jgi:hypothetical protein
VPRLVGHGKAWAEHFHRNRFKNEVALAGSADLLQPRCRQASYNLIPGFQLVDKDFVLRHDATSDSPKINLWRDLIPKIAAFAREAKP